MTTNVFTLEIIKDSLVAVGEEMFQAMLRTSMSPIIYEGTDFAVGATDARGNLLAQGNGVAAFLAALDTAVVSALGRYDLNDIKPGDVFITNTPYEGGGTHLSDVAILIPVFHDAKLIAWTVNKAHWTEVGGAQAGSVSSSSTEIFQEGLRFTFIRLYDEGRINQAVVQIIRDNVRLPDSTIGDMHAGVAAARVGEKRILELVAKYGAPMVLQAMDELLDYGEKMTRAALATIPSGVYEAEDIVEDDGLGNGPFVVKVKVTISQDRLIADFTGSAPQAPGPVNTTYAGLLTGSRCLFKAITDPGIPANGGCFRMLEVICPPGTVLTAQEPAPVSMNFQARNAAVDVFWKALAPILPQRLPAGHQQSVCATFISGKHPDTGELFVIGEPLVGGWGACHDSDGDAGQFCSSNGETYNIPCELFEARYGLQVAQYAFHDQDGGAGRYRGGKGVVLDYRVTADRAFLTYAAARTSSRPWALLGGQEGSNNYAEVRRHDGSVERYGMCTAVAVERDEVIRIYTATGGGYGDPKLRPRELVERDIKNGFVTTEQAIAHYGYQAG
ncbi:hydantoinase B/oxoprolinase family protein [Sphingomonas crocodyli]|uniref:Hydantoinase B/oxoprolinase family protein n=1 Tax=Sphingomonas crocodyli TaxID=1979270 RepID=A0A437M606_9SPHN|nr:hydantoinase B/oxoprolinase family protein [Sphingomonas crocodyli]RVT92966.1 hydantoinase B/oxoprolinase family protein [Sphingomonas crocodyli]